MAKFGRNSRTRLATCDKQLQKLFNEVVKYFDCSVLVGFRGENEQNRAFDEGHSKLKWPHGKHNSNPSFAVDVAPYPLDWEDRERFIYFGGFVKGCAYQMDMPLRWGGDWNNNTSLADNKFDDLVHFEIRNGLMVE
jgi:peptidoglycan L-alanyl-D-glutamate endopeptidase CwlK